MQSIRPQKCSKLRNYSIEDTEVENHLENNKDLAKPLKDAKPVLGFSCIMLLE